MAAYNYCEQDAGESTAGIINLALFRGQGPSICTMRTHLPWIYTFEPKNRSVLWIRIQWIRVEIRIQHFKWIRIRTQIQGFYDQKLKKIIQLKFFFVSKIAIFLSLGLHKGHPSYRRSLQPSKRNNQHFKRWNLLTIFYFYGPFLRWGMASFN